LNPVLKNEGSQIVFHSGKCIAQSILTSKVSEKKRKKLYIVGGIVGGSFVVNNLIQMKK